MFTGIITELGTVHELASSEEITQLTITAPKTTADLMLGDSVAVNGVCLTVVAVEPPHFRVQAVAETMARTGLGSLTRGESVNLERPMAASGRFDGHMVQGHVDGVGTLAGTAQEGDSVRVRVTFPEDLAPYVVEKGSICVDGISLTVTAVTPPSTRDPWLEFVVIPHTMLVTNLGSKNIGDSVNLEVDVIAKYVERMLGGMT